jgi:2-methylisocitrate lyase-like PEP mutase family enzyme
MGDPMSPVTATDKRQRFRALLAAPGVALAPSCGDAITSRLIESLGLPAIHCSGSSLHRNAGYPDAGILTMTEMVASLTLMSNAVDIPVIGDADTGFGGIANVVRTVQEYERAGAAAIHLEDQLTPKRPPTAGQSYTTITRREMVDKIRAAVDARIDESFVIIARSEVKGDLQEVIDRLNECVEAGADAAWLSASSPDEIALVRAAIKKPLIGVLPRGMSLTTFGALGADCALLPTWLETVASYAKKRLLEELVTTGSMKGYLDTLPGIDEMRVFVTDQGGAEMRSLDERFSN